MPQLPTYVILPAGTTIRDGNHDGAGYFLLYHPLAVLIQHVWDENFMISSLFDRQEREINTRLKFNYVLSPINKFASGQTTEEAWKNFDAKK